jgi:hypothetical protein
MTINGNPPVLGDVFYHWNSAGGTHPAHGNLMKIMSVDPPDTSMGGPYDYSSAVCRGNGWDYGCVDPSATNFDPNVSSIQVLLNTYAHVRADCSGQDAWAAQNIHGNPGFLQHVDLSCCRYEHEPDHKGCMDSTAINDGECCDQTIPGCVATIPNNEECCRYEGGGETKKCICCRKAEGGGVSGIGITTQIPVSDSCSQFNNPPLIFGCKDSTLWSLSKCKPPIIYPSEAFTRMKKLANIL